MKEIYLWSFRIVVVVLLLFACWKLVQIANETSLQSYILDRRR